MKHCELGFRRSLSWPDQFRGGGRALDCPGHSIRPASADGEVEVRGWRQPEPEAQEPVEGGPPVAPAVRKSRKSVVARPR